MKLELIDSPIIAQAQALAEKVMTEHGDEISTPIKADALVNHRPNSLAESYQHGQSVAHILAEWKAEPELQAAGLLHSFVYKEILSAEHIAIACGNRTAFLCQQYRAILQQKPKIPSRGKPHVIKRVKLYIAAYCDPALAFLNVASFWDHFILAQQGEPAQQRPFADEIQKVMLPLLDMLGMASLKTKVEQWVMQWEQNRPAYLDLTKRLTQTEAIRKQAFRAVRQHLQPLLPTAKLTYQLPTPAQIYNPHFPENAHPEAFQRLTVDVLVDTEEACYTTLRWIHHLWQPVDHSLEDHIRTSTLNGDRYLLTTVIVPLGNKHIRTQFNIRTFEMEQINQWGLAALHMQKRHQVDLPQAWWSQQKESYANICAAPMGALPETLYVFSPQGELFRFHRGCTVVDYAYQVHSELAHQCKRFKINGEVVSPTTMLRHLDLVELERDPQFPGPSRAWLNTARTQRARSYIERFLKRQSQGQMHGRTILERQLKALATHYRLDIPDHRLEQTLNLAARRFNFERVENLLAEIAAGRVSTNRILHPLFSEEVARQIELPGGVRMLPHQLNLAQCCKPRPGDDIIGRARYRDDKLIRLKIHRANCQRIHHLRDNISVKWQLQPQLNAVARLEVTALAEDSLLYDALQQFQADLPHITLHKVEAIARNGIARLNFTVEAKDQQLIDKVAHSLENLQDYHINEVRQMQLLFSEREELIKSTTPATFNPYRRHPVQDREMFVGRTEELTSIDDLLTAGSGVIFVQGQKRVGKTSLLLYLKKYYLNHRSKVPVFIDFQILGQLTGPTFHYEIANAVYSDLQAEHGLNDLDPPLYELFEMNPTVELTSYLRNVQSHFGLRKLVLLIDEFSRTIDAFQQDRLGDGFFQQWRGLVQATVPAVSYVMVVQQQTVNHLREATDHFANTPIWHLLELGETKVLKPLSEQDARQLIERPTYNHLEYSPEAIRYVWRLTGGRPFLIQAFCFNLVRHLAHSNRRQVEWTDIETVQAEFMHPNESLFTHLLDIIWEINYAIHICRQLANSINNTDHPVPLTALEAILPGIPPQQLHNSLQKLANQHILVSSESNGWQFTSLLFGRWLAINGILEKYAVD